ncbi:MAG: hypothetical protein JWN76_1855 [Chitinophagaceae bacterium]|nr:hypothetical protein [Chitinophagaceae bacterium]
MSIEFSKADLAPRHLTKEEIENPYQALDSFFDYAHLPQFRDILRDSLRATVTGDFNENPSDRSRHRIFSFYEQVERLIEAAHIIHDRKNGSALTRIVNKKTLHESVTTNALLFEKPQLKKITKKILAITSAEKIFLLRDKTIADGSEQLPFYDLLILLPSTNRNKFEEHERFIKDILKGQAELSLQLVKAGRVYELLSKGHLFYSLACKKEKLLFDDGTTPLPSFDFVPVKHLINNARQVFLKGLQKAESFYEGASFYYEKKENAFACFMLHQSVELTLRSLLLAFMGVDPSVHDLEIYMVNIRRYVPALGDLFPNNTKEESEIFDALQKSYIKARYFEGFTPSDNTLQTLLERIKLLLQKAVKEFDAKMEEFKALKDG